MELLENLVTATSPLGISALFQNWRMIESNQYQLTFFDHPASPDYLAGGMAIADQDWNVDGTQLAIFANLGKGPAYPGEVWILPIEPVDK